MKSTDDEKQHENDPRLANGRELNHGTKVLMELLETWKGGTRNCTVCAGSYFASVKTFRELELIGFNFIGVVKTATKLFPIKWLNPLELENCGDRKVLVSKDSDGNLLEIAVMWVDTNHRFFVGNAEGVEDGEPIYHMRWRQ